MADEADILIVGAGPCGLAAAISAQGAGLKPLVLDQSFIAGEGKLSKIDCRGHEKGGPTTPLEKRPAVDCKVTQVSPEKASDKPK